MNRIVIISAITMITLIAAACGSGNRNKQKSASAELTEHSLPIGDNSMVSLDWQGIYTGMIPCADCNGILTLVKLNSDLSYIHKVKYLGKDETIFGTTGNFDWSGDGSSVTLTDNSSDHTAPSFLVGENILFMLDSEGNRITGNLEEMYKLHKVMASLEGHAWVLTTIEGVEVSETDFPNKKPWILFDTENDRLSGFAGCNLLTGPYTIQDDNSLTFGAIASTKMFCPDVQGEQLFLTMLSNTAKYQVTTEQLTLIDKDGAPLAQFEADFFERGDN